MHPTPMPLRRAPGRPPSRSGRAALFVALVGAAVLGLVVIATRGGGGEVAAERTGSVESPAPEPEPEIEAGWDGRTVRFVRDLHDAIQTKNREALRAAVDPVAWLGHERGLEDPEAARRAFEALPLHERADVAERCVDAMLEDEGLAWRPFDGDVLRRGDGDVLRRGDGDVLRRGDGASDDARTTVRLAVVSRDPAQGGEKRSIDWVLSSQGSRLRVAGWSRWISPEEERRAQRGERNEIVTLSDGARVVEREPEPMEHLSQTPPELVARIDGLIATMTDLDLTTEASAAQHELVAIGKPAIPVLLEFLRTSPLDDDESLVRMNLVDQTLQRITGRSMGFAPGRDGGISTSEERQRSSVRQWFAWWHTHADTFEEREREDGLEGHIELTDKERRELERDRR